ncbi:MAG: hypothetical protein U0531_09485 [Dehalococcoidia bacterium]
MIPASPPATDGVPARPRGRLATAVARRLPALASTPFRRYVFGVLLADGSHAMFAVTASWLVYELTGAVQRRIRAGGARLLPHRADAGLRPRCSRRRLAADRLGRRRMLMATNERPRR